MQVLTTKNRLVKLLEQEQEEKRNLITAILSYHEQHGKDTDFLFNMALVLWEMPLILVSNEAQNIIDLLFIECRKRLINNNL